ncbi:LLM class flavin-dependent oxidoreductase [Amycolatopsis sp. CA-230715]|uniref:LLM class flavin-dependent oxidoreductase n=1 Tax=Amycolatopsis sp. CA-230715 TaxID=2745196 RepID=UPI001C00A563|nr:LLM class flavin-dependent oxidoreductase [Amycolatopsis sp. CA-230715]QWF80406.1 Alkanal monooxygenase alpha chain [Amycolatopsis sp. CA-230715]
MRFGVFLITGRFPGQTDADALTRTERAIAAAEEAGFADAWLAEHHFMPYGVCPSAVTLAAHALGATSRIEIGTAVSVLSTNHPVALAEQWAMLDLVSGGRFRLGVGRGGPWRDLEVFGTGVPRYEHGFAEGLDLLLRATADERVHADGAHFSFREVPIVPKSPRRCAPVVACGAPDSDAVRVAAERGLPLLLGLHAADDEKAETVRRYGPANPGHISTVLCEVADDREAVLRRLRAAMPGWLDAGLAAHVPVAGRSRPTRDPVAYTEKLCRIHPVGSADDCVAKLAESARRTGVEHVIMMVEGSGDRAEENIRRIGAEILPRLSGNA